MEYEEAAKQVREITDKMTEHGDTSERASRTYEATMMLYNVAAQAGDEKAMQAHRDSLHTTIDVILDSGAMIFQLKKQIKDICSQVTNYPSPFRF